MPLTRCRASRILLSALTLLALALAVRSAEPAKQPKASAEEIKLVELILKTPTDRLVPEAIPAFMTVDPLGLPEKLREPYRAKRMELLALKKVSDAKRKPPIRRLGLQSPKCEEPIEGTPRFLQALGFAGFVRVKKADVEAAEEETNCSECELETEFTLLRVNVEETEGKTKTKKLRYYFYGGDPIFVFIHAHQSGQPITTGTAFFGAGAMPRCH